jgi:hypothetical protein
MLDALLEGVLEALAPHGAGLADASGDVDAGTVGREEDGRRVGAAVAVSHPHGGGVEGLGFGHGNPPPRNYVRRARSVPGNQ